MAAKRSIELEIISANDLKKVTTFGHQSCYAVAYIHPARMLATRVDKEGGVNPTWNSKLILTCSESLLQQGGSAITVEIYNQGSIYDKLVGTASIPLRDHVASEAENPVKPMVFEVKRPSGRVQGVLNLSAKVGEKRTVTIPDQKPATSVSSTALPPSVKDSDKQIEQAVKGDEPAVGIPVTGYPPAYPPQQYAPQQYAPQQYSQQYNSQYPPQQYYAAPYSSGQTSRQGGGSSGAGLGLLGGLLGGLLVGDILGGF